MAAVLGCDTSSSGCQGGWLALSVSPLSAQRTSRLTLLTARLDDQPDQCRLTLWPRHPRSRPLLSFSVCFLPFVLLLHMGEEPDLCGGSLCSDQLYSSVPLLVAAVRRRRDTQPVNRHRGGDLRRPQYFPNQNPSPLFRAPFPPRACLPCQCDVHQCHRMQRGLLFTEGFLLVVFDLPPRFHCSVLPRCLLRTIGFCTAAFEPSAVSLTVPLTGSVVAVM